jgi:hypothetical protein
VCLCVSLSLSVLHCAFVRDIQNIYQVVDQYWRWCDFGDAAECIGGIAHVPPSSLASASSVDGSVGVSALPVLAFAVFA